MPAGSPNWRCTYFDRRDTQGTRRGRAEGHRYQRGHRFPGDARRPGENAPPRIHGGILAVRDDPKHTATLAEHQIEPIDLVVVNLYPFEETVARPGSTREEIIENIDIGGPSLIRAAAKNHAGVAVVTSPDQYAAILDEMRTKNEAPQPGDA